MVSDEIYDTEGLTTLQARVKGSGEDEEIRTYQGTKGHEKLMWSSNYGDISPGETAIVDPNSAQFRDDIKDLFMAGGAIVNGITYNAGITTDEVDALILQGELISVNITGENRVYSYAHPTVDTMKVTEVVGGDVDHPRATYNYSGPVGGEVLQIINSNRVTSAYTYDNGALIKVMQTRTGNTSQTLSEIF